MSTKDSLDYESDNLRKRKRRRISHLSNVNPLSDARLGPIQTSSKNVPGNKDILKEKELSGKSKSTAVLSKADAKARALWHRKSGAGYSLFVEYYGNQPRGVVCEGDSVDCVISDKTNNPLLVSKGRGQSRASKKRRRKKTGNSDGPSTQKKSSISSRNDAIKNNLIVTAKPNHSSETEYYELLQELRNKPQYKHMEAFLTSLSRPLPLTFRMRQVSDPDILESSEQLQQELSNSHYINLVRPVSYDPTQKTIYQSLPETNLSKSNLSKKAPHLKDLLVKASTSGIIARQELGSMLPVIALVGLDQIQPGYKLLDMCASPGSKTLQALEIITSRLNSIATNDTKYQKNKKGRIVANDIHPTRLKTLQNAVIRSGMSQNQTSRIIYTNHNASLFPTPKSNSKFDCILADVPCSGDGTVRKDFHILPGWMPSIGNALHSLQLNILKRSLELVRVGGVVVYSTCSLNPVEDEAVVSSALRWANGGTAKEKILQNGGGSDEKEEIVELLEWPSHVLPGFKRRNGVNKWKVADYSEEWVDNMKEEQDAVKLKSVDYNGDDDGAPKLEWYSSFKEAADKGMANATETMWYPQPLDDSQDVEEASICLEKCTRLWPQDHDTGGFFVALLRKNVEI